MDDMTLLAPLAVQEVCKLAFLYCSTYSNRPEQRPALADVLTVVAGLAGESALIRAKLFNGEDHNRESYAPIKAKDFNTWLTAGKEALPETMETRCALGQVARTMGALDVAMDGGPDLSNLVQRLDTHGIGKFGYIPLDLRGTEHPTIDAFTSNMCLRDCVDRIVKKYELPDTPQTDRFDVCSYALGVTVLSAQKHLLKRDTLEIACSTFLATAKTYPLLEKALAPDRVCCAPRYPTRHYQQ